MVAEDDLELQGLLEEEQPAPTLILAQSSQELSWSPKRLDLRQSLRSLKLISGN
jgi:hypothetical protein